MLKAFQTFAAPSPKNGCCLVYAKNHSQAKSTGMKEVLSLHVLFTDMRAWRCHDFDKYAKETDKPYAIDANWQLPDDAPKFYQDEYNNIRHD